MDNPLNFLLTSDPRAQSQTGLPSSAQRYSFEWVTVWSTAPLRVMRDNDSDALDLRTVSLQSGLVAGDRVLLLKMGRQVVVLGKAV